MQSSAHVYDSSIELTAKKIYESKEKPKSQSSKKLIALFHSLYKIPASQRRYN